MTMPWESIFGWTNSWAMLGWLILAFAPQRDKVLPFVFYMGCGLLALTYASLILPLMALFASPGGTTIGWIHYLAFDLFVGLWVARNADRHGYPRLVQIPILFFVLMAGPFGLLLYLILRATCKGRPENSTVPS
jgi:Domain of unknown function (DUF4281)